jgi:hypothetical protein
MKKLVRYAPNISLYAKVAAFPIMLVALLACHPLRASLKQTQPPSFQFDSGISECCNFLTFYRVEEVAPENQNVDWLQSKPKDNTVLWLISSEGDNSGRVPRLITYGKVPTGFVQKIPLSGEPPPLVEGRVYDAYGPPVLVPETYIRFTIREGKPVRLPVPGKDH